jgi:hypothetical protein
VGPRAVLDAMVKRKFPSPRRESNPRTPIVQPNNTCIPQTFYTNETLPSRSDVKHGVTFLSGYLSRANLMTVICCLSVKEHKSNRVRGGGGGTCGWGVYTRIKTMMTKHRTMTTLDVASHNGTTQKTNMSRGEISRHEILIKKK